MKALLLLMLGAIACCAQPAPPIPTISFRSSSSGTILLGWNFGVPRWTTVSNITTRATVVAGIFEYYMVTGLEVGSTNLFVVYNTDNGDHRYSNVATGVASLFVPNAYIRVHTYMVTVPSKTNGVTEILTSTNLNIWTSVGFITNTGPTHQFVWTNDSASQRFFRSISP